MDTSLRPENLTSFADMGERREGFELKWGGGVEEMVNPSRAEFRYASPALCGSFAVAGKEWL
jgi:hypothetical protein